MPQHNHVAVVATTFVILSQEHPNFLRELSARCPVLTPLLVARIGAVLNYLVERRVIADTGAVPAVSGRYPHVKVQNGDWAGAVISVQNALSRLSVPSDLKKAEECVAGIQNDMVMLGLTKVLGVATGMLRNASNGARLAENTISHTTRGFAAAQKVAELRDVLKKTPHPVDALIAAM